MLTYLVRLKPYDPRRGHVLRRYAHRGIRFLVEHGWYRVDVDVADYLRGVRQVDGNPHSPPAFDVCTDDEARQVDAAEEARERATRATDDIPRSEPRVSTAASAPAAPPTVGAAIDGAASASPVATTDAGLARRGRRERE